MIEACRTCLKLIRLESSQYFEIEGANVQLSPNSNRFKILSVMPEMALNISKKSLICTSCHQSLETIYQFKAKCLRTESMIMRYIHSKPDLEIEALDLKDVAFVNNTGFVCGNKASNENNTSHENTNHGNLLCKEKNTSHSNLNCNLDKSQGHILNVSHSKALDKEKNTSHSKVNSSQGSLLHKKLLDRVNASLGNNNSVSLHLIENVNTEKCGKDNQQQRVKLVADLVVNRNNSNTNRGKDIRLEEKSVENALNQGKNYRYEAVGKSHTNLDYKKSNQQKQNNPSSKPGEKNESNKLPYYNSEANELSENVIIKQEFIPEDEDSMDNEDAGVDVDESITVVKHELVNDDETELIIPPENTILNVSVKSDDSKPVENNLNAVATNKEVEHDDGVVKTTKYHLRKRVCNKTREVVELPKINTSKRNIRVKIMQLTNDKVSNDSLLNGNNALADTNKEIVVNSTVDTNKEKLDAANSSLEANNMKIIQEENDSIVDSSFDNASDEDIDDVDYSPDEYSEEINNTDSSEETTKDEETRNKSKYSLRNHATNQVKGVTTIRLKCIGSNLSIRRVIPKTDIKSYKVPDVESQNPLEEAQNNLKHETEISVMTLEEKQRSDNQLQLPQLSVIPIIKKNKEQPVLKCNETEEETPPVSIIPISKSMEVDEKEEPPFSLIPTDKQIMEGDIKALTKSEDQIELVTIAKSEDVIEPKSEETEPISMEVDVILNESIKSNDSGIQNTSGSEQTDETLLKCQVCLKNFITRSRLKTHMLCHTDERPYKCTLCIKGFNDKSTLNKHLKIHSGIKEYECEICQRQFYCKGNLNKHMSTHSGERPYRCNVCNRDFSRNEHLKQHRLIHTGDKNFECDICSKKFARRDSLIIHMMVHTGVRNYVCEYCDKRCIDSSTLKKHLRSHTGDKPYECETCHRRFTQKTHLTIHRRKHTGERPYNCTVCSKGFYSSNYLKIHKRTHTKEQPYQCDVCKKRFSTVSNLRMHKKIHTGIRDFECGICSKMFIHKHDLRKHMMVHTQEKPFGCHVCGKAFNKKVRAKQHIINMHKEVDISTIVIEHHNTYVKTEPKTDEAGSVN